MQDFSFCWTVGSLRVVTNIDEAEIQGAEIDFKYRATEELSIYGGFGTLILKLLLTAHAPIQLEINYLIFQKQLLLLEQNM